MEVTAEERKRALLIKQAATEDAAIDHENMADFEFVQHAIIAKDNVAKALMRIKRLQAFKGRYGILMDGAVDDGLRDVIAFDQSFPGFTLGIGHNDKDGTQLLCYDFSKYKAHSINKGDEGYAVCMRAFFYALQASQCDFDAIRAGVRVLGDFGNLGWENFSVQAEKRAASLYSNCYPMRIKEMAMMNCNALIRVFYKLLKVFLSEKARQALVMPQRRDEHLQNQKYPAAAIPTAWGGKLTLQVSAQTFANKLQERYENAAKFRLDEEKSKQGDDSDDDNDEDESAMWWFEDKSNNCLLYAHNKSFLSFTCNI